MGGGAFPPAESLCVLPCSSWRSGCAGFAAPWHGGGCCQSLCSLPGTNPCCAGSSQTSDAQGKTGQPPSASTHARAHKQAPGSPSTLKEEPLAGGRPECVSAAVWARDSCRASRTESRATDCLGSRGASQALHKRPTCGLWCPSNSLRLMLHFQDCSPPLCCSFCFVLFTCTWKECLPVPFHLAVWLSTPEVSAWPPACMSSPPFSSRYWRIMPLRFSSNLFRE